MSKRFPILLILTAICCYTQARDRLVPVWVSDKILFQIGSDGVSFGNITIGLFGGQAPKTVQNFVTLSTIGINGKSFIGTKFQRLQSDDGGDVLVGGDIGSTSMYNGDQESNLLEHNEAGLLSMEGNGSRFGITLEESQWRDGNYAIFGKVLDGLNIVKAISNVPMRSDGWPISDVIIMDAKVIPVKGYVKTYFKETIFEE